MPARRKKKKPIDIILAILAILLLLAMILRFDVIADAIDPAGKLGLQNIANDAFPILLGATLVTLGVSVIASPWVAVALIAVGAVILLSKIYGLVNREKGLPDNQPITSE
jgi:hypothetical protein